MDLTEIINNPVSPSSSGLLIIPHNFIWDLIIFNGHFQMGILMIGLWTMLDLFDLLFWDDWRILRQKIKEKIKLCLQIL
jgi:hypothetical protein